MNDSNQQTLTRREVALSKVADAGKAHQHRLEQASGESDALTRSLIEAYQLGVSKDVLSRAAGLAWRDVHHRISCGAR